MAVSISAKAAATASAWLVVFSLLFGVNNLIDRNYAVGQNATPTGTESPTFTCHLPGPAEWFTGSVRVNPLFEAPVPARARGASVTFEPGARTAWHTHPLGQTLIVTSGCGRVQRWGGPMEEIRPGDVVWFAPGEKHWHGAAPLTAMTHVAIVEVLDGKSADRMEKVSDEQYQA